MKSASQAIQSVLLETIFLQELVGGHGDTVVVVITVSLEAVEVVVMVGWGEAAGGKDTTT